ncbi:hypothetical protein Z969_09510 [Clostridium novyi A str. 4570]|uniref:RNA polymerase sigma-70 region 4 domain-containing protein n=1 Tax=Clostridium novyi A str. 4570 TaxID=1444290 RepID=A0AA88ZTD0_CLONO|nr:sigma-70 family RNA polymerase sigma factor [Clostridium novyi]KGN00748.1 hypothetical protein Z969_09510 [Clostridium novyi A str. 4570]
MNYSEVKNMLYNYKYLKIKLNDINLILNSNIDIGIDKEKLRSIKPIIENKLQIINNAIDVLDPKEKELVDYIFFNKGKNRHFAIKNNIDESTVGRRKRKIINKLTTLITQ